MLGRDYSGFGFYFVTICCGERMKYFGDIKNGVLKISKCGVWASKFWKMIPRYYQGVSIDQFVVMPNHVHGIIVIVGTEQCSVQKGVSEVGTGQCSVRTGIDGRFGLLSKIVKSYKNVVTNKVRRDLMVKDFKWQRSFYDRIIRNKEELMRVRKYIVDNPKNWFRDRNNLIEDDRDGLGDFGAVNGGREASAARSDGT